jgi:hypothetical protein
MFGHSFESLTAKTIQQMHVFISGWGLKFNMASPIWKNAYSYLGKTYNLSAGGEGVKLELSKPIIEYDIDGDIKSGEFGNEANAKQFAQNLLKKNYVKNVELNFLPLLNTNLEMLELVFSIGPDLKRTALKMCLGLSTLLPNFQFVEIDDGRRFLNLEECSGAVDNVFAAYHSYPEIDSRRKALSHVIYVERGEHYISGVVQFFGVIQLYCHLGEVQGVSDKSAIYASLNPITGTEEISTINSLDIEEPQTLYTEDELAIFVEQWLKKFRTEALQCGATNPPDLRLGSINIDRKQ